MLFIQDIYRSKVMIADTDDGVIETVEESELPSLVNQGIKIKGYESGDIRIVTREELLQDWLLKAEMSGILKYYVFSHDNKALRMYKGPGGRIQLPPVEQIEAYCFFYTPCDIESITIPMFVNFIGECVFAKEDGTPRVIKKINWTRPLSGEIYIHSYSFDHVQFCSPIELPFKCNIGNHAFRGCSAPSLLLTGDDTELQGDVFKGCKIPEVHISGYVRLRRGSDFMDSDISIVDVDAIGLEGGIFSFGGSKVRKAHIRCGNSGVGLPRGLFFGCMNLEDLTIDDGIVAIDDYALANLWGVQNIRLPRSLKTINPTSVGFYKSKDRKWNVDEKLVYAMRSKKYTVEVPAHLACEKDRLDGRRVIVY